MRDQDQIQTEADEGNVCPPGAEPLREDEGHDLDHQQLLQVLTDLRPILSAGLDAEDAGLRRALLNGCLCQVRELADVTRRILARDADEFAARMRAIMASAASS